MSVYIGLDCGGTATRCVVGDEERVLGRAATGTVKLMNVNEVTATERLLGVLEAAAREAGVRVADAARICVGIAGLSSEGVRIWAEKVLRNVTVGEVLLTGDEEVAFEAAFKGGGGVLVVAGTGSNVMGRCGDGTTVRAGGWGPMLGDEGSGYWIGLEAIKAGLRAQDRGAETCLLKEVERHWGLANQGELIALANAKSRPQFAELVSVVARCADSGDALAAGVLERAGRELAEQVSLAVSKMHQAGCAPDGEVPVAFTGSVLGKVPRVRKAMVEALMASIPNVVVAEVPVDPLEGALWMARRG